jgi:hypothetical protein
MENVIFGTDFQGNEYAVINHGNEQYTSMPKSIYDEMVAAQENATPIL